jgi:hypothetical protein
VDLLGKDSVRPFTNVNFTCPALQEKIVVPCGLSKCRYNIDYAWSNNCLLAYAQQQGTDHLSPEEISYLYTIPVDQVNRSVEKSLTKLRREILVAEAESNSDLTPQFKYIESKRLCCVCGSKIESKKDRIDVRDLNMAYCSEECLEDKNQYVITLEHRSGLPIKTLLTWVLNRFKSLSLVEKSLGIPKWAIYELCLKFLDKNIQDFFPDAKEIPPKKRVLYRTSGTPHTVFTKTPATVGEQAKRVYEAYGRPSISFDNLNSKLQDVLNI